MIPTAAVVDPDIEIVYGAGALIHVQTLLNEIAELNIDPKRVKIDPQAGVVTAELIKQQRGDRRYESIGSTLTGTGYAAAERCKRSLKLAYDYPELKDMLCDDDVVEKLTKLAADDKNILVEGHQGFGLSNYHGDYPYVSSRDCTAAEMLSELGLGPRSGEFRILLLVKVFPTRNHAGKLDELPPSEAQRRSIHEKGGGCWDVEDRSRRVGWIDFKLVKRAAQANSATEIVLTGVDYLDRNLRGASRKAHSEELKNIIDDVQRETKLKVTYLSTGPETESMIDLREVGSARKAA
jgi:adenylosuccinate synthase